MCIRDRVVPVQKLTREEIVNKIKEAGIVGMGGAGFPTHVKMCPKDPGAITHVIVNLSLIHIYFHCLSSGKIPLFTIAVE